MMGIFKKAVEIIKNGGVVIAPTDTVYGLICDAANKKAVEKIFKIKKRPKSKPLPIFVKDLKMAKEIAEIDREAGEIFKKGLAREGDSEIERKKSKIKLYGVDKDTIAIRIPKYRLLLGLAEQLNRPLAQTSANISGKIAPAKIQEILKQFSSKKYQPDLVIDAGDLPQNKPSKIIDLTIWPPKILRP